MVKREAGGCEFVPPPLFGRSMAGMFGAGSVFLVYLSTTFFRRTATAIFGAILLLVAALPRPGDSRLAHPPHSAPHRAWGAASLTANGNCALRLRGDEAFD